ncbi:MAG: hypothetical protein KJZ54_02050 [Phycisphaerales bacterium]|nr:hypothetical protein [Phycisphaerales bacterium]
MPQSGSKKSKPVHVVRYGAIKAAIWRNETSAGPMYNVTVSRTYKEGDEWRESTSFGADDLLVLAKALNEAHSWIFAQRAKSAQERDDSGS